MTSGKLRLEPLKLNVGETIKGAYQNDEIKHIYTLFLMPDLSASYKADTVAKVQGTEFSHRLNTNIARLASTVDISTSYIIRLCISAMRSPAGLDTMTIDTYKWQWEAVLCVDNTSGSCIK